MTLEIRHLARLPLCLLNSHRSVRRAVRWNGAAHVGTCERCGNRIIRSERGTWSRNPALSDPTVEQEAAPAQGCPD